jgi:hypothetical protein
MEKGKKEREEEGYTGIYISHESSNLSLSGVSTQQWVRQERRANETLEIGALSD